MVPPAARPARRAVLPRLPVEGDGGVAVAGPRAAPEPGRGDAATQRRHLGPDLHPDPGDDGGLPRAVRLRRRRPPSTATPATTRCAARPPTGSGSRPGAGSASRPDQTAVLYAPTWRDHLATRPRAAAMTEHLDVDAAAAALGDSHVILLRGHRFHAPGPSRARGRRRDRPPRDQRPGPGLRRRGARLLLAAVRLRADRPADGLPRARPGGLHRRRPRLPLPVHRHRPGAAGGHDRRGRGAGARRPALAADWADRVAGVRRAVQPLAGRPRRRPASSTSWSESSRRAAWPDAGPVLGDAWPIRAIR